MRLKLSDAIMLGTSLREKAVGSFLTKDGRSCAIGAALDAVGALHFGASSVSPIFERWPWSRRRVNCPECQSCDSSLWTVTVIIAHLNDGHEWTRERIAEWVATIEPVEPEQVSEARTDDDKPAFTDFQHKEAVYGTKNVQGD